MTIITKPHCGLVVVLKRERTWPPLIRTIRPRLGGGGSSCSENRSPHSLLAQHSLSVPVSPSWVGLPPFLIVPEIRPRPLVMTGRGRAWNHYTRGGEKITSFRLLKFSVQRQRATSYRNGGRLQSRFAKALNHWHTCIETRQKLHLSKDYSALQ